MNFHPSSVAADARGLNHLFFHLRQAPAAATLLLTLAAGILPGCSRTSADTSARSEATPAAIFKEGHGLKLTPVAARFIGLATAEFTGRLPAGALLQTVQGSFVYVENGGWLLRTPVTPGAGDATALEIKDGLYEGDIVVTHGVRALWLAELHFLRAGQACAHGDD
ncbi:MAG: hypothetical protein A3G75_01010 [Verrucomicrobia bacterium RIFCSPLOWO2_12_FULL_64_8]|nr:MAG: hypothetical protein A3G75_01010 [Verrucomicrobia bacterium RIFCSPLOWO2_12_FULL_64_8]